MAYVTQGAARRPLSNGWFAGLRDTFRRNMIARRTYNELMSLSDRELDDLGIGRGDIADIAHRAAEGR